jgi:hypothetical protein
MESTTPTRPATLSFAFLASPWGIAGVAVFAVLFVACSGADDSASRSAESSTVEPGDPTAASTSDNDPGETAAVNEGDAVSVSFSNSVQPILEANCASCHSPGGPGAAHVELKTAGDAQLNAIFIASAVDVGKMPPWPAGSGDLAFHGDRRLSDSDKEANLRKPELEPRWVMWGEGTDDEMCIRTSSLDPRRANRLQQVVACITFCHTFRYGQSNLCTP